MNVLLIWLEPATCKKCNMDIVMPFDKIDSMRAFESGNTEIEAGFSNINEIYDGETIRFEYKDGESVVGTISLTPNGPKSYDVSGFFC